MLLYLRSILCDQGIASWRPITNTTSAATTANSFAFIAKNHRMAAGTATSPRSLPIFHMPPLRFETEMDEEKIVNGMSLKQWASVFRPGMPEYAATTFSFTRESQDFVRIAFGNSGPVRSESGSKEPVYTHAVMLSPAVAVELAGLLLKHYAEPETSRSSTSGQL
jgi:hypothetical protein